MLKAKYLFLDTETSGLDPKKDSVLQVAALKVSEEGEELDFFQSYVRPLEGARLCSEAFKTNGYTHESVLTFPHPLSVVPAFYDWLASFDGKLIFAGFNCGFDIKMMVSLTEALLACDYWGDYTKDSFRKRHNFLPASEVFPWAVDPKEGALDVMKVAKKNLKKGVDVENHKLVTVCAHLGIELKAHDALEDIRATLKCWNKLRAMEVA